MHNICHKEISINSFKGCFILNCDNISQLIPSIIKEDIEDILRVCKQISPRNNPVFYPARFFWNNFIIFPIITLEKILNKHNYTLFLRIKVGKIGWANSSLNESLYTGWYCSNLVGFSRERQKIRIAKLSFLIYYDFFFSGVFIIFSSLLIQ